MKTHAAGTLEVGAYEPTVIALSAARFGTGFTRDPLMVCLSFDEDKITEALDHLGEFFKLFEATFYSLEHAAKTASLIDLSASMPPQLEIDDDWFVPINRPLARQVAALDQRTYPFKRLRLSALVAQGCDPSVVLRLCVLFGGLGRQVPALSRRFGKVCTLLEDLTYQQAGVQYTLSTPDLHTEFADVWHSMHQDPSLRVLTPDFDRLSLRSLYTLTVNFGDKAKEARMGYYERNIKSLCHAFSSVADAVRGEKATPDAAIFAALRRLAVLYEGKAPNGPEEMLQSLNNQLHVRAGAIAQALKKGGSLQTAVVLLSAAHATDEGPTPEPSDGNFSALSLTAQQRKRALNGASYVQLAPLLNVALANVPQDAPP